MSIYDRDHKPSELPRTTLERFRRLSKKKKLTIAFLGGCLLFGGCGESETVEATDFSTVTAIIMENGNAMIVDCSSLEEWMSGYLLHTLAGNDLQINDKDTVKIVKGQYSHEVSELIAQGLVGEDGEVSYYTSELEHVKVK